MPPVPWRQDVFAYRKLLRSFDSNATKIARIQALSDASLWIRNQSIKYSII